jgi:hypothetical protein
MAGRAWSGHLVQLVPSSFATLECTLQQLQRDAGRSPAGLEAVPRVSECELSVVSFIDESTCGPVVVHYRYPPVCLGTCCNPVDAEANPAAPSWSEAAAFLDDER